MNGLGIIIGKVTNLVPNYHFILWSCDSFRRVVEGGTRRGVVKQNACGSIEKILRDMGPSLCAPRVSLPRRIIKRKAFY